MASESEYTRRAARSIQGIFDYISRDSPAAAQRVAARIERTIGLLVDFPDIGRPSAVPGIREMRVPNLPYVIVYRNQPSDTLIILGVYHTAQRRPTRRR